MEAFFLEMLPVPPLTRDQVKLLERDNVVDPRALGFKDLGIQPTAVEAILPTYLGRFRRRNVPGRRSVMEGAGYGPCRTLPLRLHCKRLASAFRAALHRREHVTNVWPGLERRHGFRYLRFHERRAVSTDAQLAVVAEW